MNGGPAPWAYFDIFSDKPAREAADAKKRGLDMGYGDAQRFLGEGWGEASGIYDQAAKPFQGLYDKSMGGFDAYGDATGVNGAEGLARARALFTATPGYQEGLNMTLDQNDRRAASRGMLASGNTIADTTKLATDYSNTKYGDYVGRFTPYLGAAQGAAAGLGAAYSGKAGARMGMAGKLADFGYQHGTGVGTADQDAELARYGASKNFWDTLLGGADLFGKFTGFGGYAPKGK